MSMIGSGRVGGAVIGLVTQVYLAQALSAAALGTFYLATSLAAFLAVIATCGLPMVATRFLVRYRTRERADLVVLFMRSSRRTVLLAALAVTAVAAAAILAWPGLDGLERDALLIGCLAAPGFALSRFLGAAATAFRRFNLSYLPDLVFRPIVFLAAIAAIGILASGIALLPVLAVFAALVTGQAVFQHFALGAVVPRGVPANRHVSALRGRWLRTALPLTGVIIVTGIFADAAILSAGFYLNKPDLAVFGVAIKIALVVGFVQATCFKILQPDLAEALVGGDRDRLAHTIVRGVLIAVGVGLAAIVGVAVAGELVLSVFGEEFVVGRDALLALLFGQVLLAAAGPATQILALTKGQGAAAWSALAAGLCLVVASALFIPPLGLAGAALAWVVTQALWAALLTVHVRRIGIVCDLSAAAGLIRRGHAHPVTP
jgi:O-antigen/teichoic acid export membrane protein